MQCQEADAEIWRRRDGGCGDALLHWGPPARRWLLRSHELMEEIPSSLTHDNADETDRGSDARKREEKQN